MAGTDPAGAFIQGLKSADPFKVEVYEAYLGNATSLHSFMSLFNGFLHDKQPDKKPDNEVSTFISSLSAPPGKSIDKAISDLAMGTLALGVSRMDDGWGFHDCAKAVRQNIISGSRDLTDWPTGLWKGPRPGGNDRLDTKSIREAP